jgi:hypothetical protein
VKATPTARLILAALSCTFVAIPFLSVHFPPITDLPQHVAQVRLFLDAVQSPESPYQIQWLTPYSLCYAVIGSVWTALGPENTPCASMLALGVLWTLAVHLLAAKRNRPAEAAVIASLLFLNHVTYWGFCTFLVGWPVFALWFLLTTREPSARFCARDVSLFFAGGFLLYLSHALWFVAGLLWLCLHALTSRLARKVAMLRVLSVSPIVAVAALRYWQLADAGFVSETHWRSPTDTARFSIVWFVDALFGGLRGPIEHMLFAVPAGWLFLSLYQNRGSFRERVDRSLLAAGVLFFAAALALPELHMKTISFGTRWMPPAVIFLLLAVPAPVLEPKRTRPLSVVLLAAFSLATSVTWMRFQRNELSGLSSALARLPESPRLLGLDFIKDSPLIKGRPYLHMFAYGQVLRGGELNTSLADLAPALVAYANRNRVSWTRDLEWFAEDARGEDFAHFDYAIIQAFPQIHVRLRQMPMLEPITLTGRWRLYRIARIVR